MRPIYWCGLDPTLAHEQGAVRPVIVVSADAYNKTQSPLVAIVPLTKAPPKTTGKTHQWRRAKLRCVVATGEVTSEGDSTGVSVC